MRLLKYRVRAYTVKKCASNDNDNLKSINWNNYNDNEPVLLLLINFFTIVS